ncbi:MAG: hypothetical protein RLZZ524_3218 [Pseudomonadota bacterium]|jgi:hypothetical protein
MPITVRVPNIATTADELRRLPANLERLTILRMSQIAYDAALRGADRHTKTGALRQSLYNRAIPKGREVGHDPARAPHALFVNFGTRPHVIRPKDKKALRWVAGNGFVFAKKVNHPGYRGDAYIVQAATEAVREFARIVNDAIKES